MVVAKLNEGKLKEIVDRLDQNDQSFFNQVKFLQKQINDLARVHDVAKDALWDEIRQELYALGRLPDQYSDETHTINFNTNTKEFAIYKDEDFKAISTAKKILDVLPKGLVEAIMQSQNKGIEL